MRFYKKQQHYKTWMEQKINPISFWITMHMEVFDIENRTLRVIVQERYDEPHYFTL